MKRVVSFCLVLLIATLAGCVDVDIKTKMDRDGKGTQRWQFNTTALVASKLKEYIEKDPYFQKLPGQIQEEFKQGEYTLTWTVPFQNVSELEEKWHAYHFEKRGSFRNRYSYSEIWDFSAGSRIKELNKKVGNLVPITVRVSVEMPGTITDTNADRTEGNVANWNIPVNELVGPKTLTIQSQEWNVKLLAMLGVILAIGLAGVLVAFLYLSRKSPAAVAVPSICPFCSSPVPLNSGFCNVCGAKLK